MNDIFAIHKTGHFIVTTLLICSFMFVSLFFTFGLILLFLLFISLIFYRDRKRVKLAKNSEILTPVCGIVESIKEVSTSKVSKKKQITILSTFLDSHVVYAPISGKISKLEILKSNFDNFELEKILSNREEIEYHIKNEDLTIEITHTPKYVPFSINFDIDEGKLVEQFDKIGFISAASKIVINLPNNCEINIVEGQRLVSGETIIAIAKTKSKRGK